MERLVIHLTFHDIKATEINLNMLKFKTKTYGRIFLKAFANEMVNKS